MRHLINFRDFGGYAAHGGRKIRKGLLYRSGHLDGMRGGALRDFLSLGIKSIIDLRSPRETRKCRKIVERIRPVNLPIELEETFKKMVRPVLYLKNAQETVMNTVASIYANLVASQMQTIKKMFDFLSAHENYPILIHCRAGQDRTGFACAMIHLALGVDERAVIEEYLLSNRYSVPQVRKAAAFMKILSLGFMNTANFETAFTAHERYLQSMIDTIAKDFGGVERYLEKCGFGGEALKRLRGLLLE